MLETILIESFAYILHLIFVISLITGVLFIIFEKELFSKKKSKTHKYLKKAKKAIKQNNKHKFWKYFELHKKHSKTQTDIFNNHYLENQYWKMKWCTHLSYLF